MAVTGESWSAQEVDTIEHFLASRDVPGVAIALVHNGEIVKDGGFGKANLLSGAGPDEHTMWPIASLTKSFTAVAAMQCVEAGLLDLDAPVQDYIPDVLVADASTTSRLTMRRLLTHTSGLGRTGHQDRTREESVNPYPTREALVAALDSVVPQAPVGACFSYSNESYALAGELLNYCASARLRIASRSTSSTQWGCVARRHALGCGRDDSNRTYLYAGRNIGPYGSGEQHAGYEVVDLVGDYQTFLSTGGIASNAHDLALYQLASMNYVDSPLGLTGAALEHMQSVQHSYGDSGWGYGLGYRMMRSGAIRVVGHSGGLPGVSTYSLMIPGEGAGVVVLTNRSDIKAFTLAEQLMSLLRGPVWRTDLSEPLPIKSAWGAPSADDLAPYLGDYRFRRGPATVSQGATGIVLRTPSRYDGPVVEVHTRRVARDRFISLGDGQIIEFRRDGSGNICAFLNSGYVYERS